MSKQPIVSTRARIVLLVLTATVVCVPAFAQHYTRTDLIADQTATAPKATNPPDPNLVNAWGMSRSSGSPWWISDNGTGLTTLYSGAGAPVLINNPSDAVTIPMKPGLNTPATPTGTVFNYTTGFPVAPNMPAAFIFVTEDGTISGWNFTANRKSAIQVFPVGDNKNEGAVYKGCTLGTLKGMTFLYVADFGRSRVDVFDNMFHPVRFPEWAFRDPRVPRDFAPFNVQNVGGNLVVTFAKHKSRGSVDQVDGPGLGFVSIFDLEGRLVQRLEHSELLNAPWGIAMAPSDFGVFSHRLLIGNFGDGTIHVFNPLTGRLEGTVLDSTTGNPLWIDRLWALNFGSGTTSGSSTELYFTAGPDDEAHGILGKITAVATEQRGNSE